MKKQSHFRIYLFIGSMFFLTSACDTDKNIDPPDETHFVKYYGTDENESGVDLIVQADGTAILLGKSLSGDKKIYLVKVDDKGAIIWEKYLGYDTDIAKDIEPTLDGNFVLLSDYLQSINNYDLKITKVNADGDSIDGAVFGFSGSENSSAITPISDGGFIIAGTAEYSIVTEPGTSNDVSDMFHFRCDQNFDFSVLNWEDGYGKGSIDGATKAFEEASGNFSIFGFTNGDHLGHTAGKINLQYFSLSPTGLPTANENYLGDFDQDVRSNHVLKVPPSMGSGYFIIGTRLSNTGSVSIHASKLRSSLNFDSQDELLDEEIPLGLGVQAFESVSATASENADGQGFLLLANETLLNGHTNISLSKIDQLGNVLWYVSLGSEERDDRAAAVAELPDGRILVLGTVALGDQTKMALFKLNSQGQLIK